MASVERVLWQRIIQEVVAHGGNIIRPWFTQLEPISLEHGLLEIQTPGKQEQEYCRTHAVGLFTGAAQNATGRLVGVCFLTPAESADANAPTPELKTVAPITEAGDIDRLLSADYTFDGFVTGPCNRLAHAACSAVSDSPGKTYNPLFLHGASGLGKTHLLQATCHKIILDNPDAKVQFLTCETFVNHFIDAVENGDMHQFRYRYRHVDVLVIDDIQFLADHEQSQEEFFHT
ncbi:MAG: ATP-binding protein, partial [Phycisphaerae bacterium]|nr:ATP-binding protein [Phycisphaerae bacterium]